jgi:hypothetical protein
MSKTIGQQIEDFFLLHALDLELLKIDRAIDYRQRFDDLKKELTNLVVVADLASSTPGRLSSRLNSLSSEARELIIEFYEDLTRESNSFLSELSAIESEVPARRFNELLDTDYFENATEPKDADKFVGSLIVMGAALPDWFEAQSEALVNKFDRTVANAARRGFTNDQIVARVKGTQSAKQMRIIPEIADASGAIPGFTYSPPVTGRAQADATSVMTSGMHALVAGVYFDFFEANSDVFQGIQHKSILDLLTSKICRSYANMAWDLKHRPIFGNVLPYPGRPPLHFRCRSQHVPILLPLKDLPAALIDSLSPETRQLFSSEQNLIANSESFNSWFSGIDPAQRAATVGRTFNLAWEKKELSAGDFLNRSGGVSIDIERYKQRAKASPKK